MAPRFGANHPLVSASTLDHWCTYDSPASARIFTIYLPIWRTTRGRQRRQVSSAAYRPYFLTDFKSESLSFDIFCSSCLLSRFSSRNKMASAQVVIPSSRCADSHCSRFAVRFVSAEPWTHHRTCSNHLVCRRDGSHCRVCEGWGDAEWDGLERLMVRLAARQEKRRKAGRLSDTGSTSEDSLLPEGRLIIDETPARRGLLRGTDPGQPGPRLREEEGL